MLPRLERAVGQLQRQGYAVIDGALGRSECGRARQELLQAGRHMRPNHTHLVRTSGQAEAVPKRRVLELDLAVQPEAASLLPLLAGTLRSDLAGLLQTVLAAHQPQLGVARRLDAAPLKLQLNTGGCFPVHTDGELSLADTRVVTAILYLNPGWSAEHGGQLRCYPLLGPPVDIEPVQGRLVLFSSPLMPHRVLTSSAPHDSPRCCATFWIHSTQTNQLRASAVAKPTRPSSTDPIQVALHMLAPAMRAFTAKITLAEEWAQSLRESHAKQEADLLVEDHWRNVDVLTNTLKDSLAPLHEGLEMLRVDPTVSEETDTNSQFETSIRTEHQIEWLL